MAYSRMATAQQAPLRGSTTDVNNVISQLSALSVGYPWDQQQAALRKRHQYRCRSSQSEGTLSPCRSPDLVEPQLQEQQQQQQQPRSTSLVGRMRGLRQDVQRKFSRLRSLTGGGGGGSPAGHRGVRGHGGQGHGELADTAISLEPLPGGSSMESLPSGSGSSTQALVREGSFESSMSPLVSRDASHAIGRARALVDYVPSPYDKDALKFKKGDIIDILAMSPSGMWRGRLNGCVGYFKFINVEVIPGATGVGRTPAQPHRGRPRTTEELLRRVNLEECISVFVLHGYEDVESFKDLQEEDLDYLGIKSTETRAKIRAAIRLLHDYDLATDTSHGETDSAGGEDEDQDADEDSSSDSELGLGRQPQPLPLTGKFPPGLGVPMTGSSVPAPYSQRNQHHSSQNQMTANSLYYCGDLLRREEQTRAGCNGQQERLSPPAPAPSSGFGCSPYLPNVPPATPVQAGGPVDSYVVARRGGKVVTVEAGPRATPATAPPPVLPRTGSSSSSSSSRQGRGAATGRLVAAAAGDSSQGQGGLGEERRSPQHPVTPPRSQSATPGALGTREEAAKAAATSPDRVPEGEDCGGLELAQVPAAVNAPAVNMNGLNGHPVGSAEVDREKAILVLGLGNTSERSSDSGVSSSSSQPSSSSRERDRESRRERRNMAMTIGVARQ